MDHFTVLILVACSALGIGGLIGLIIGRASCSPDQRQALQRELDTSKRDLNRYRQEVGDHFTRTAELVNELTETYREVHQHLAQGADALCDTEQLGQRIEQPVYNRSLEQQPATSPDDAQESPDSEQFSPPKDYAPKTDPSAEGTLSETYGLQSQQEEPEHDPSKLADHARS